MRSDVLRFLLAACTYSLRLRRELARSAGSDMRPAFAVSMQLPTEASQSSFAAYILLPVHA